MPAFVIVQRLGKLGDAMDAVICAPGILGFPDRKTDVPVRIRLTSEQTLCVDDEPRRFIWSIGENGVTTFLVDGSTRGVRNRERTPPWRGLRGCCSNSPRASCRLRPKVQNQNSWLKICNCCLTGSEASANARPSPRVLPMESHMAMQLDEGRTNGHRAGVGDAGLG